MFHLSLVPRKARPRKTIEDFMSLPEGVRAELIDGELIMSPSPRPFHQDVVGNIFALLRQFALSRHLGRVYVAPLDVHLPSGDVVEPDVLFISSENLNIVKDWIRGAPDLVIEVISPELDFCPFFRVACERFY
jgi:Uma2 family endonuclease